MIALIALALVIRLVAAVVSFGSPLAFDAKDYDRHARSIVTGHGYPEAIHQRGGPSALRPPGFPFALAASYAVVGGAKAPGPWQQSLAAGYQPDSTQADAGRILQALIGTVVAALAGLVAFQLWGRRVGFVALAIAAVYPPLIVLGVSLVADLLFVMFVLAALAAALRAREGTGRTIRWAAAAGVFTGLAWLTRSNGYFLLPPLALLVWVARPRFSRAALAAPLAIVVAALLTIAPWTIRNAAVMHAFIPVSDNQGYTLAGTYNDTARGDPDFKGGWRPAQQDPKYSRLMSKTSGELDEARVLGHAARTYAVDHPAYVAEVGYCNTLRLVYLAWLSCGDKSASAVDAYVVEQATSRTVARLTIVSFALLALLAIAGAFTRAARRAPWAFWLVPVFLWTTVFVLAANRFRAPLEPFLIMLAALALVRVRDAFAQRDATAPTSWSRVEPTTRAGAPTAIE